MKLVWKSTSYGKIPLVVQSSEEKLKIWITLKEYEKEIQKWLRRS